MNELRQCIYHTHEYEVPSAEITLLSSILANGSSPLSGMNVVYNGNVINQATYVKISVTPSTAVGGSNAADALLGITLVNRGEGYNFSLGTRHMDIIGPVDVVGNTSFESEFSHSLDVAMTYAGGSSDPIFVSIQVFA